MKFLYTLLYIITIFFINSYEVSACKQVLPESAACVSIAGFGIFGDARFETPKNKDMFGCMDIVGNCNSLLKTKVGLTWDPTFRINSLVFLTFILFLIAIFAFYKIKKTPSNS